MTRSLKVLAFTSLFPSAVNAAHGIFLEHRLRHLSEQPNLTVKVVVPTPWFPSTHRMFGAYADHASVPIEGRRSGLDVIYPRYPTLPKIGMTVAPSLMAAAMLGPIRALARSGFDADIIDAYYLYPDGVAAAMLGRMLRKPVVLTALGSDVSLLAQYHLPRRQMLWASRRAMATTTVSRSLLNEFRTIGAESEKLHLVEHGVDTQMFQPTGRRSELRLKLGLVAPTLLSVGHLIERKGHDLAIRALSKLQDVRLVIVGVGPLESTLRQLACQLHVADRVRFTGRIDQTQLAEYLEACELLINCSDREGIANVLLESLACGTPVAATPFWGSPEVIRNPDVGLLFADRSVSAIREGIRTALSRHYDRPGIRRYSERYCWRTTARAHHRILLGA